MRGDVLRPSCSRPHKHNSAMIYEHPVMLRAAAFATRAKLIHGMPSLSTLVTKRGPCYLLSFAEERSAADCLPSRIDC